MTLLAIRTDVQTVSGRSEAAYESVIDSCANSAIAHLGTRWKHPPLEMTSTTNTVAGDATLLLPASCFAIFYARENTSTKTLLRDATIEDYNKESRDSSARGTPGKWTRYNDLLYIFAAIPDGVYEIELNWWKRHPALSNDTDEHLYYSEWEEAVRLLTLEYFFVKLNEHQKAAAVRAALNRYFEGRGLGKETERGYKQNAGFDFG